MRQTRREPIARSSGSRMRVNSFRRLHVGVWMRAVIASATLAVSCGQVPPASAQMFLGNGTPHILQMPSGTDSAAQGGDSGTSPDRVNTAPVPQLPLPGIGSSLRITGEQGTLNWVVYLTESQLRHNPRFRLGYLSAVSVMPEASFLNVRINGVNVGRTEIRAPGAVKVVEFPIAQTVLKAGYNSISISANQRHRVDCSVKATYELWSQLDPTWTGLVFPVEDWQVLHIDDLPAIPSDIRGATPIRIVIGNKHEPADFERFIRAAQVVALAGHFSHPVVDFGPLLKGQAGLNLVIGTTDEVKRLITTSAIGEGARLIFLPAKGDTAATVVLTGADAADLNGALDELRLGAAAHVDVGSPQGINAFAVEDGIQAKGGQVLSLAEFGIPDQEFSGRVFHTGVEVNLPADAVAANYAAVTLGLAGGYMPNLDSAAQITINVNGRSAASMPLSNASGELFTNKELRIPLGLWHPGHNRIDITAFVPSMSDAACETNADIDPPHRFLFLNKTQLRMPFFAHALNFPQLSVAAGTGAPYGLDGMRPRLLVPVPDAQSMSAAATIAVQIAMAAGHVIDFNLGFQRDADDDRPTLLVAPAPALDPALLRAIGIDPDNLHRIWGARADVTETNLPANGAVSGMSLDRLRNDIPAACTLPRQVAPAVRVNVDAASDSPRRANGTPRDIVSEWQSSLDDSNPVVDRLISGGAKAGEIGDYFTHAVSSWFERQVTDPMVAMDPRASLIVGQTLRKASTNDLVTVVTAPNSAVLQASAICLTAPQIWTRLEGRTATLDASDGNLKTFETEHQSIQLSALPKLDNVRLLVASWASLNPTHYMALILIAAIGLGLSTNTLLSISGRKIPRQRDEDEQDASKAKTGELIEADSERDLDK